MFNENSRTAPVCATRSARRHVLSSPFFGGQPPACLYVFYYTYIHTTCRRNSQPVDNESVSAPVWNFAGVSLTRARNTCASQLRFAPLLVSPVSLLRAFSPDIREHSLLSKSIVHSYVRLYNVKYNSI